MMKNEVATKDVVSQRQTLSVPGGGRRLTDDTVRSDEHRGRWNGERAERLPLMAGANHLASSAAFPLAPSARRLLHLCQE
jgi:hypothetical protein